MGPPAFPAAPGLLDIWQRAKEWDGWRDDPKRGFGLRIGFSQVGPAASFERRP